MPRRGVRPLLLRLHSLALLLALGIRAAASDTGTAALHPVVVVEEHHHALPYWYDAARNAAASGGAATETKQRMLLVHVDTHDDLALPRSVSTH